MAKMGVVVDECIHGLTAAWCSICKEQQTKADRRTRRRTLGWTEAVDATPDGPKRVAQFDALCPDCSEQISAGEDMVYLRDGQWTCESCAMVMDLEDRRQ